MSRESKRIAKKSRSYDDLTKELMGDNLAIHGARWSNKDKWVDESSDYQRLLSEAERQRTQDYGGVFQMYDEEGLFTKITSGMQEATQRDAYQPFFEMQRSGAEGSLLAGMSKVGSSGFEGSGGQQSMMDALQEQYAQATVGYEQQAVGQQQQAQQTLDDIIRSNQQQSYQLRQMENQ